jgi:hypothetical protein
VVGDPGELARRTSLLLFADGFGTAPTAEDGPIRAGHRSVCLCCGTQ